MLNAELAHFARAIVGDDKASSLVRETYANYSADIALDIYRNNYRGNLHDALAGAYPVVKQLVGDDFFRFMGRKFIAEHPSRNANLHRYGAELAAFVAAFEPANELAYLADVAALEWACHLAYFADDADTLDIARLAQVPAERYTELVLHLQPSCHLQHSRYPVAAIWHAHQPGACDDFRIDLGSGACDALVCRKDGVVTVIELAEADAAWLQRMEAGMPLGDAAAETLERHPHFDLLSALQMQIAQNVFASFDLGATS
jgi:hypothetical protein